MTSITNHPRSRSFSRGPSDAVPVVKRRQHQYHTTTIERLLLMATAVIIPLEHHLPAIVGFSIPYIMFAILAGYTLLNRPRALARTQIQSVFLAAFTLIMIGSLIESVHPFPSYALLVRMGLMIVAAIFVASLCRDRGALRASIYGYLIAEVLISVLFFLTSYGVLQTTAATDFAEASQVRHDVFANVEGNLNEMAISTAQGAAVALALGLSVRSPLRRKLFFGIALVGIVAGFLSMSRSGMIITGVSCATVMFAYGVRNVKVILVATALVVGALILIPEAVFSRLSFSPETTSGKTEARMRLYKAAIDNLPDYVLTGVGAGNFKGPWGQRTDFYKEKNRTVYGAHNAFIQVTINWGLAGLLVLILVVYLAYCCLPRGGGKDVLVLCLYGIAVALLLRLIVTHGLADKEYSLGLGLLVGGYLWIWSKGIVPPRRRGQRQRSPAFEHTS
jgi:O-Antigen ligase